MGVLRGRYRITSSMPKWNVDGWRCSMIFNQKYTTPNIDRLYTSWWNSFAERLSSPNSLALGRVFPTFATRMLSECWFNRPGREAAQTKSMEELAVGSSWRFVDSKTTETTSSHRTIPNVKILGSTKHIYIYQIALHVRTIWYRILPTIAIQCTDVKIYTFCIYIYIGIDICNIYTTRTYFFKPIDRSGIFPSLLRRCRNLLCRRGSEQILGHMMVQKSGVYRLRLVVYPYILQRFYTSKRWLALGILNHQQWFFCWVRFVWKCYEKICFVWVILMILILRAGWVYPYYAIHGDDWLLERSSVSSCQSYLLYFQSCRKYTL